MSEAPCPPSESSTALSRVEPSTVVVHAPGGFSMAMPPTIAEAGEGAALNLPVTHGEIRFAVGDPIGLTSNSWKMWTGPKGDVYIACRDNFTHAKVSLHASGRWRMGFTEQAMREKPELAAAKRNRAWDVWDEPPATVPNVVSAFQLVFPTSELGVRPEQRASKLWTKNVVFVEPAPPGKILVVTLFVTTGEVPLRHPSEPSGYLASLGIGNNRQAQLIAHHDPEGDLPEWLARKMTQLRSQAEAAGVRVPQGGYAYLLSSHADGSRFLVGAHVDRITAPADQMQP